MVSLLSALLLGFNDLKEKLTEAGTVGHRPWYYLVTIWSSPSINTSLTAVRVACIVGRTVDHCHTC